MPHELEIVQGHSSNGLADPGLAFELFKYAEVGRCVNSVTHDVNNYLGAILAYSELVSMDMGIAPDSRRMLTEIVQAVHKSTKLLSTLTTIARKERPNMVMADMGQLTSRVLDLRSYEMKINQVNGALETEGEMGLLVIDEPRIVRAIIYLIMNGIENCNEHASKRMDVKVRGTKEAIEITFNDSGPTVPESDQAFIFEPFFTTKGQGHIGLGLTHAREISRLHGGDVTYDAEEGFVMTLPRENGLTL